MDNTQPDYRKGNKKRLRLSARRKKRTGPTKQVKNHAAKKNEAARTNEKKPDDEITWDPVPQTKSEQELRGPLPNEDSSDHWPSSPEAKPEQDTTEIKITELFEEIEWDKKYPVIDLMLPPSPEALNNEDDEDEVKHDQNSEPMPIKEMQGVWCRCCHLAVEGGVSLISQCFGTYADMLRDCFGIEMDMEEDFTALCEYCEARLQDALAFKRQVQACEERLKAARGRPQVAREHPLPAMEHSLPVRPWLVDGPSPDPQDPTSIATIDFEEDWDSDRDDREHDSFVTSDKEPSITEVPKLQLTKPPFGNIVKEPPITKVTKPNPRKKTLRNINKPPITAAPTLKQREKHTGRIYKRKNLALKLEPTKFENGEESKPKLHRSTCRSSYEKISQEEYRCIHCSATVAANADAKKKHKRQYHLYHCLICSQTFPNPNRYVRHKLEVHNQDDRVKCNACDRLLLTSNGLRHHMQIYHKLGKVTKCPDCDYVCYDLRRMKFHQLVHNPVRNFPCRYCKKTFLTRTHMRTHEKIHTGVKEKVCAECGKAFVQKASLNYHMQKYHPNVKF